MGDSDKHVKRARQAIAGAQGRHDRVVRIHRANALRGAEPVAGFVVSTGIRWVVVQRIGSDLTVDGYTAVRWKHLDSVHVIGPDDLMSRAVRRGGIRPVEPTALDPTTTGLLLRSIPDRPPLVTIWAERHARATSWIGTIVGFENKNLHLRPIDRDGRLAPGTFSIAFREITRIDLRSRYATALAAAAGLTTRPTPAPPFDADADIEADAAMDGTSDESPSTLVVATASNGSSNATNGTTPRPDDAA